MKAIASVAVVLFFACAVFAQTTPCCTPDKWEMFSVAWDPDQLTRAFTHQFYDYVGGRSRIDIHGERKDAPMRLSVLSRHDIGRVYFIEGGSCRYHTISPMERSCVPNNSTFFHTVTVGGLLKSNVFRFEDNDLLLDVAVTQRDCIPINEVAVTRRFGTEVSEYIDFYPGIVDDSVFVPPNQCTPAPSGHFHKQPKMRLFGQ
eukprot:TRINITY_DN5534_c0_g1_i1.p1 TRINITY_DN5534_c0_g1~~TRINITY_DN5534_c0_g1_i1.p1  ORF type:complete len:202 (+),score=31.58 TRINITY_DN5534_c0_g1_i1:41-646(+)